MSDRIYVVTDIEVDGDRPGRHSMRAFGSVAVSLTGVEYGRFEAVLSPLEGATTHPDTMAWWATQPGAWAAATTDARPAVDVMSDYVAWLSTLPTPRFFTAAPLGFDGVWIDYYLRELARQVIDPFPHEVDPVFASPAFCLRSFAAGVTDGRRTIVGLPTCRRSGSATSSTHTRRSTMRSGTRIFSSPSRR